MTNHERADRIFSELPGIVGEMRNALEGERWNLAARRAQEVVELVIKGLLSEMGVDYPRTHDVGAVLAETIRQRHLDVDPAYLDWLSGVSGHPAALRGPAFYHEIDVTETEAREAVEAADRVVEFGHAFLIRLRQGA